MAAGGGRPGGAARAALRVRQRAVPRAAAGHDLCSRARVRPGQLHVRELLRPWSRLPLRRRLLRARDGADRERHGRAPAPPGGLPRPRGAPRRPERRACGRGLQGPRMSSVSSSPFHAGEARPKLTRRCPHRHGARPGAPRATTSARAAATATRTAPATARATWARTQTVRSPTAPAAPSPTGGAPCGNQNFKARSR